MRQSLSFCFAFLASRPGVIARQVAIPALSGTLILFLLLDGYCAQLIAYIRHPSGSVASQVLGIAAAGLMIMLFLHASVAASVARLVLGSGTAERSFFGIRQRTWRVYVGNLRFAILLSFCALLAIGAVRLLPQLQAPITLIFFLLAFWLSIRFWFFLTPICLEGADAALSASWRLSAGRFWLIAAVVLGIACAGLVLQFLIENILSVLHLIRQPVFGGSFYNVVIFYQENLPVAVILVGVGYLFVATLLTIISCSLYQQIIRGVDLAAQAA